MTDPVLRELELQLDRLRKRLELTDIYQDIRALERVIRLRKASAGDAPGEREYVASEPHLQPTRIANASTALREMSAKILASRSQPTSTKDLFDELSRAGVTVPGENPSNNLSAHLSKDDRFLSWGRDGWTLADVIEPDEGRLQSIAERFVGGLDGGTKGDLASYVSTSRPLPPEVDGQLLGLARTMLGRKLVETERRTLRAQVEHLLGSPDTANALLTSSSEL